MKDVYVVKADGQRQLFDLNKVKEAVTRAGVTDDKQKQILDDLKGSFYNNIPTSEIYHLVSQALSQAHPAGAIRFRLKKAIMELGPTGYPFEVFIGHLLKEYGYQTEVSVKLLGGCVEHEVDVLAKKDSRVYFVECKYHNQQGLRSDVKVVLYVHSRAEDLIDTLGNSENSSAWIFTNTKFSTDAIKYAECKNMRLTGWDYPSKQDNLQTMIEENNLYPITVLPALSKDSVKRLLEENIVLVKELLQKKDLYQKLGLRRSEWEKVERQCLQITER
jgi:Holliday junction resolvase-like predicted endonuclease